VSPVISVVCSALERAAVLVERGVAPAKALRQASAELQEYGAQHAAERIPERVFELGVRPS
jgi:hypothetical protein